MPPVDPMIVHRHGFVKELAGFVRDRCGIRGGERVVLAVSGGADSTALLLAMAALAPRKEWSLDLHVAHVNHHLRDDADGDERFVAELADRLGLPFHRRDIAPGAAAGNVEASGRRLRYAALREVAAEVEADAIATAHHGDDQLETLLMRLVRGASVHGMRGIAARRKVGGVSLIRPMLWADRAAATAFLREHGQAWREDHTNADVTRARALLRAQVLPVLRKLRPDAARKATDSAARMAEASRLIERITERLIRRHVSNGGLKRETARAMDRELLGEVVRRMGVRLGAPGDALGQRVVEPMVAAARDERGDERVFKLAGGVRVVVSREAVSWTAGD